jgi:ribosomal protein L37AE/L43A
LRDDPQLFSNDEIESVITQMARAFVIEIYMTYTHRQIAEYGKVITQQFRDVLEARNEAHACPDCGGDLREGVHQKQLDADWFVCEKGEDVKADYFEGDGVPF